MPILLSAQSLRSKVNKGNEQYQASEYEQALGSYKDALLDDPLNENILFNEADALFKMEKYQEAREGYQKILATKDLKLAAKTHYNIGNTYFMENKLQESIESYKRSLELDQEDFDTKYNLELARARLKEQSEKQQSQNQDDQNVVPSDYAKKIKEQADLLIAQGLFNEALKLINDALKIDQTVMAYQTYINRLNNVVQIDI